MGIGSAFWSALGDGCRWLQVLTYGADGTTDMSCGPATTTPNMRFHIAAAKMFQKPYVTGGTGGQQNVNDGYDTGYFALINSATDPLASTKYPSMMVTSVGIGGSTNPRPQWKQLGSDAAGLVTQGEFLPAISGTNLYRGIYQTGFIANVGATRWSYAGNPWDLIAWIQWPTASTRRYWLWHYQPWAWFGTVPEVVADIAMKCGLSVNYIDQVSFDNAYDAYDLSTGDFPWSSTVDYTSNPIWFGMASKWQIGCSRSVGQKCIDLLMKCAAHSRDLYYVNEAGKLAASSFTRPLSPVSGLGLEDGVVGDVDWAWISSLIVNSVYVSWGSGVRVSGNFIDNPDGSDFSASDEPRGESYTGLKLSASLVNSDSVAKYGALYFDGYAATVNIGGQPIDVTRPHFPYLITNHASLNAGLAHVHYWLASDSKERRMVTVVQDFRALDWGIGARVDNVAVTDDGQTITTCWCIERTYDFDRLTVTSVLMEQPANT